MTKKEFFDRDASHYFFENPKVIAGYCKENCKEEVSHILRVADEVCRRYFLFDLNWDMERTYEPVQFDGAIDWSYIPAGDPEFVWQFNRHHFFLCLGQAYQLTGDEKYAKAYVELTLDWIENVKINKQTQYGPWRTLETGLRGEYWNKALRYFMDSPYITDEFLQKFYDSMVEHAEHLIANHSPFRYMSNWGVLENHGLFEIGICLPQSDLTRHYVEFALKNLEIESRMQIMDDGVQWEQSPMYHNEVLHCYLDVLILAKRNGIKIPASMQERVHRMALANVAWRKPDDHQFMMGDSDDMDLTDMITTAAVVFKDPVLRQMGAKHMDYDSIWDLGMAAAKEYETMEQMPPEYTSISLSDSGNTYLRSGWDKQANLCHFHCGTMGAGHGHSDQLHMDLVIQGEDVLVDSGRFTYVVGPNRYEFKDPSAHNTITMDDKLFTVCKDSWECSKLTQPVKQQFVQKGIFEFVQAGHLGYLAEERGAFINRKIIYIKPDLYVVVDEMYSGDIHSYQQYWHFNEQGNIKQETVEQGNVSWEALCYEGKNTKVKFHYITPGVKVSLESTRISRHYNQALPNWTGKVEVSGDGFTSMITVIQADAQKNLEIQKLPVRSELKHIEYPASMAEAVKLTYEGKDFIVVVCHQEVNSPTDLVEVDGCMGYGNVIVFAPEEDRLVGEVLNW